MGKNGEIASGRWTEDEHQRFLKALELHGTNFKLIASHVQTRTSQQARGHYKVHFQATQVKIGGDVVMEDAEDVSRKRKNDDDNDDDDDEDDNVTPNVQTKKAKAEASPVKPTSNDAPRQVSVDSGIANVKAPPPSKVATIPSGEEIPTVDVNPKAAADGEDLKPPAMVKVPEKAKPTEVAPIKPEPVMSTKTTTKSPRAPSTPEKQTPSVVKQGHAQSLLFGFCGFFTVIVMKILTLPSMSSMQTILVGLVAFLAGFFGRKHMSPSQATMTSDFFQNEDVQTTLAGLSGFVAVAIFKKLMF